MSQLVVGTKAFAQLYGRISLKKAYEIFNMQNDFIDEGAFYKFCQDIQDNDDGTYYFIVSESEFYEDVKFGNIREHYIVHESYFIDYEDYYELDRLQKGKPYYIPEKEELLKYAEDFYCEKTKEFLRWKVFSVTK